VRGPGRPGLNLLEGVVDFLKVMGATGAAFPGRRWGLVLLFVGIGVGARLAFSPLLEQNTPFITLFPAIAASAWVAGRIGGVVATFLSVSLVNVFIMGPPWAPAIRTPADVSAFVLFVGVGLLITWLADSARASAEGHRESQERLQVLLAREEAARRQAESANVVRDQFLATVSHELRTPLNAVIGWAHMLRTRPMGPELIQQAVTVIERNALRQAKLVDDLLDISRILASRIRLDVALFSLSQAIGEAIDSLRLDAESSGVGLELEVEDTPVAIVGDRRRIEQVVFNLVGNAIKFTAPAGRVAVRLVRSEDEHTAVLTVSDTGVGIARDFLPYVFDAFRQEETGTMREKGGLGLGLAIARQITELHGGSLAAASEGKGRGATFTVRLPLPGGELTAPAHDQPDATERLEIGDQVG
jgi:signal transduction histidine kinase